MHRKDFQAVAKLRIQEAKVLLDNGHFAGAYYLAGYAVECALKACIAKQTRLHDFPPPRNVIAKIYTHELGPLLDVSGLKHDLQAEATNDPILGDNWNTVIKWSEQKRYETSVSEAEARELISAINTPKNGVLSWLKKRW